jgi:hypothetical protein
VKINILADEQAAKIYGKAKDCAGLFPTWIPGTQAALFHDDSKQITKSIPAYIRDAKHTPEMQKHLIRRSKEATRREKSLDFETYETIAWKHFGESFGTLSLGRKIRFRNTPTTYFQLHAEFKHWTTKWMVNVLHANYFGKPQLTSSRAPARPVDLHRWPLEKIPTEAIMTTHS